MTVTVRPFELEGDLDRACEYGVRAREEDPAVEPFTQRLPSIASGSRALLHLWRVAEGEDGRFHGLAFAAVREWRRRRDPRPEAPEPEPRSLVLAGLSAPKAPPRPEDLLSVEVYVAVAPHLRRQGLGRRLLEPLTQLARSAPGTRLRARVRRAPSEAARGPAGAEGRLVSASAPGDRFLAALGFRLSAVQLSLARGGPPPRGRESPGVRVRPLDRKDKKGADAFRRLCDDAWEGAPDAFETRPDELEQLFSDLGRLVLLGEVEGETAGYLSGVDLAETLAIEEVAVLPRFRRFGVAHALLVAALQDRPSALLTVDETNAAARRLYQGLGFQPAGRRTVWELSA